LQAFDSQLEQLQLGQGWQLKPLGGGFTGQSFQACHCEHGCLLIKYLPRAQPEQLQQEARGLDYLGASDRVLTPQVVAVNHLLLVLEWLAPAPASADAWRWLGQQLGELHRQTAPHFGFGQDNYCGSNLQPNPRYRDGFAFFAEQRLVYQARLAYQRQRLLPQQLQQIERLAARLPELVPEQPPVLIHGDLWSGNLLFSRRQERTLAFLIDPAAHYGWAEAELAMTRLFGGFDPGFYRAYQTVNPFEPGWEERVEIYNLYHLLNHLNLFGESYLGQINAIIKRF
jgi:fructosamine-3-kinase